jgi:hypothetical protein
MFVELGFNRLQPNHTFEDTIYMSEIVLDAIFRILERFFKKLFINLKLIAFQQSYNVIFDI